ncbi:nitrogen permease regulator of amino acid transport activity 3-domain-containing protein [Gongronella butleri]|nr:nitrogen permease regulator of amino acid transport activity 3-domain-containing protein [Gongronella butleri]
MEHQSSSDSDQQYDRSGKGASSASSSHGDPLLSYDSQSASLMDIYGMGGNEYDHYPILSPYNTLLLLEDPEEILKNMPLDASPTLVQLIQILTPTQTLQELHLILDCSLAQIYRLAAHLIFWQKAKLIHPIHPRNVYVLSPRANFKDLSTIEQDFNIHNPNLNLRHFLSQLSYGKPLHRITPAKEYRNMYLEAITFLVRRNWVQQLHMYLTLMVPWPSEEEGIKWAHDKAPKEVADLFIRLVPYMDGKHHIDEIMYREAVSRKQLALVLKYYRQHIVTMYHSSN